MSIAPTQALDGARTPRILLRTCTAAIAGIALFAMTAQGGINGGGRTRGTTARWKKAIVTLKDGDSIAVFEG
jgi:hypothetical protein